MKKLYRRSYYLSYIPNYYKDSSHEEHLKTFFINYYASWNSVKGMYENPIIKLKESLIIRNLGLREYIIPKWNSLGTIYL